MLDKNQLKKIKRISETEFKSKTSGIFLGLVFIIFGIIGLFIIIGFIFILYGVAMIATCKKDYLLGPCPYCENDLDWMLTPNKPEESFKCFKCKQEIFISDYKFYTFEAIKDKNNPDIEVLKLETKQAS